MIAGVVRERSRRRGRLAAAVVAAATLVAVAVGYALLAVTPQPRFVEYAMQQPQDTPTAIAAAADGTVWFTIGLAEAVGRIRDRRLERLPKPGKNVDPIGLGVAPDGTAWYTDAAVGAVARMTPTGETASFRLDTPIVHLGRLAVAPDGAAWFAEPTGYSITRLKDGAFTRHVYASVRGGPYGVAVAADGSVWATLQDANQLLSIGPDGEMRAFGLLRPGAMPTDVATAPDGSVWFIEFRSNRIGRFREGRFEEFGVGDENAGLTGLAVAPDGAAWFGMLRAGALGRLRGGRLETFRLPRERARPYSVAADRAGNVWYADISGYVGMLPAVDAGR
jgi:virginiamycin B lyase